jgi:hypothetical protein
LVGTALGAAFDAALEKAKTLANGLEDPIKNFDALKEAGLLSSRSLEKQVDALLEAGRTGEAYARIQADLTSSFGDASAAKEYRDAVDNLNREWSRATVTLGAFVAGPLAEFLERLRVSAGGKPKDAAEAQFQRDQQQSLAETFIGVGGLVSAVGGAAALTPFAPAGLLTLGIGAGLIGTGKSIADSAAAKDEAALQETLNSIPKILVDLDRIEAAGKRDLQIQQLGNKAIIEKIRGNQELALLDEKRRVELEKIRALEQATPEARENVEAEFSQQLAILEENIIKNQRNLNVEVFKEAQTREQIERSIEGTLSLLGTQRGTYRDTLRTVQQIEESIAKAREEEARIGFEIDQARVAGSEEEANRLVDKQRTASQQTRAALLDGALKLTEAGESLRDNLRSAVVELTRVRSDPGGLNRFLTPQQRGAREQEDFRRLLPRFREAEQRARGLVPGLQGVGISGPTQGVNQAIRDFIKAVDTEFAAVQQVNQTRDAVREGNEALATINERLADATTRLADKDWVVSVNVVNQAGGSSTVNAINGLA